MASDITCVVLAISGNSDSSFSERKSSSNDLPRCLMPIEGVPLLSHVIPSCATALLSNYLIVTSAKDHQNHGPDIIAAVYGGLPSSGLPVNVTCLPVNVDSEDGVVTPLHCLQTALPHIFTKEVLIMTCDLVLPLTDQSAFVNPISSLIALHKKSSKSVEQKQFDITCLFGKLSKDDFIQNKKKSAPKCGNCLVGFDSQNPELIRLIQPQYPDDSTNEIPIRALFHSPKLTLRSDLTDMHVYLLPRDLLRIVLSAESPINTSTHPSIREDLIPALVIGDHDVELGMPLETIKSRRASSRSATTRTISQSSIGSSPEKDDEKNEEEESATLDLKAYRNILSSAPFSLDSLTTHSLQMALNPGHPATVDPIGKIDCRAYLYDSSLYASPGTLDSSAILGHLPPCPKRTKQFLQSTRI